MFVLVLYEIVHILYTSVDNVISRQQLPVNNEHANKGEGEVKNLPNKADVIFELSKATLIDD